MQIIYWENFFSFITRSRRMEKCSYANAKCFIYMHGQHTSCSPSASNVLRHKLHDGWDIMVTFQSLMTPRSLAGVVSSRHSYTLYIAKLRYKKYKKYCIAIIMYACYYVFFFYYMLHLSVIMLLSTHTHTHTDTRLYVCVSV